MKVPNFLDEWVDAKIDAFEDRLLIKITEAITGSEGKIISASDAETDKVVNSLEATARSIVSQVVAVVTSVPGQILDGVRNLLPHFP